MRHQAKIAAAMQADHKPERRLAANAVLLRENDGTMTVRLHQTEIARRNPDGSVNVQSGGFHTRTTAVWLASALAAFTGMPHGASIAGGGFTVSNMFGQTEVDSTWTPVEV